MGFTSFTLAVPDLRGRDRAVLALNQEGEPTLIFRDPAGKDRVALWRDQKSEGMALDDETGKPSPLSLSYFDRGQAYQNFK
jgi:hypothetical protein